MDLLTLIVLVLIVSGVAALIVLVLVLFGRWKWNGLTRDLHARLEAAQTPPQPAQFDARELDGLPPVVQRYFRAVLPDGARMIGAASVEHSGTFNMGASVDQWKPFTSRQRVVTRGPGFVWDGRIMMVPGLIVCVHDAYVAGEGNRRR